MSRRVTWGLIGYGSIGRELCRQVAQPAVAARVGLRPEPEFILRSKDNLTEIKNLPDVIFLAIPSSHNGQPAYEYISRFLAAGKLVITAEKGALANHYTELRRASDDFQRLGVEAAVGGGTRLVSELAGYCRDPENISRLELVLNGTLTAIFSAIAVGASLEDAVRRAAQAGYTEPGQGDPRSVIRSEAECDIPKKTAILFNRLGFSDKVLDWQKLSFQMTEKDLSKVLKGVASQRFVVSISPHDIKADVVSGFRVEHDDWNIVGGFQKLELDSPLANLQSAGNGFVITLGPDGSDGTYSLTGPGAGPRPTVNTMLDDYLSLC